MALTNVTATELTPGRSMMPHRKLIVSIDLDNSYPTGGYAIDLSAVDNAHGFVIVNATAPPSGLYRFWWNPVTSKLMSFTVTADSAVETTNATNLSAITGLVLTCECN